MTDRPAGEVLPAQDTATGAPVLLHALDLPELLVPDQVYEQTDAPLGIRLAEQVTALAAQLPRHPRLLAQSGAAADAGLLWVAEEGAPGSALSELAGAGPVPPFRVAELAADLAGALRALHEAGLVHGNVTADAVLVCEDGAALLGGLLLGAAQEALAARLGGPVPRRVYEARADLVGARAERWPPDSGPAADCWSLGVLLYRLLTGHSPYPETDLPTLLGAVRDGRRHPADGCGPLRGLVEDLLSPAAARPTAEQAQVRLRALLAGAPEPYGPQDEPPLLPVPRPAALAPVPRSRRSRAVERASRGPARPPRVPPALLGPLLVGGVLLTLIAGLAAVVLVAG